MPGPKKRTPQQILEYQIRTQVWLEFLMEETGAKSINQLGATIDGTSERGGTKWADYANLKKASFPNQTTLKLVDSQFSGSYEAFLSGPNGSRLFDCMWSRLDEIHEIFEVDSLGISHELYWLNRLLPYGYLRQCNNDGLQAIIGGITQLLESSRISERQDVELGMVPTQLSFLAGCLAILRFAIERDYYHQYSYVIELVEIIGKYFGSAHKPHLLQKRNIDTMILRWVYSELDRWARYSQAGIFYRCNGRYPNEKAFLDDPRIYARNYKNALELPVRPSAEEHISFEMDISGDRNRSHFNLIGLPTA